MDRQKRISSFDRREAGTNAPVGLGTLARRLLLTSPDRGNASDLEGSAIHGSKRVEWGVFL
jgi:hypothetical protein